MQRCDQARIPLLRVGVGGFTASGSGSELNPKPKKSTRSGSTLAVSALQVSFTTFGPEDQQHILT